MPASSGVALYRIVINFPINLSLKGKQVSEEQKLDHFTFFLEAKAGSEKAAPGKYDVILNCVFPKYKGMESEAEKKKLYVLTDYSIRESSATAVEKYFTFSAKKTSAILMTVKDSDTQKYSRNGKVTVIVQVRLISEYLERPKTAALDNHQLQKPWQDSDVVFIVEGREVHCHSYALMSTPVLYSLAKGQSEQEQEDESDETGATSIPGSRASSDRGDTNGKAVNGIELPNKQHKSFVKLIKLLYPALFLQDLDEETVYELEDMLIEYNMFRAKAGRRLLENLSKEKALRALSTAYRLDYDPLKESAMEMIVKMSPKELNRDPRLRDLDQQVLIDIQEARGFNEQEELGDRTLPSRERDVGKVKDKRPPMTAGKKDWKYVF